MTAEQLMQPRYEIIADAPLLKNKVGEIITSDHLSGRITLNFLFAGVADISPDSYPHIFKKLNWWEHRKEEEMPKKLICKAIPNDTEIMEIVKWEMDILFGFTDLKNRKGCGLRSFNPEYGYFPVD